MKNYVKIIFIKDPGVLGFVMKQYKEGVVLSRYYLDGISYEISLEKDEYNLFSIEGEYDD